MNIIPLLLTKIETINNSSHFQPLLTNNLTVLFTLPTHQFFIQIHNEQLQYQSTIDGPPSATISFLNEQQCFKFIQGSLNLPEMTNSFHNIKVTGAKRALLSVESIFKLTK